MNDSPPVRLGIIGCGNVLEAYMPQCQRICSGNLAELIIACGREGQRERALALGVPRFTTQENEVLTNSDVDLILVLTSMREHARLTGAALSAGKHVLVEKPMATNLQDAQKLIDLAHQKQRHLVCAPFSILSPTFQTISNRIRRGDIGEPCLARARYGWA